MGFDSSCSKRRTPVRVVHLIPYDGIGGVESAARTVPSRWGKVSFMRAYLVTKKPVSVIDSDWHGTRSSENSLFSQWELLCCIWRLKPHLLIGSLWRMAPVLIVLQWLRPRMKSVLFLHLSRDVHLLDWLLNRLAMWRATEIWADSHSTLQARVPARLRDRGRVISFMIASPDLTPRADVPPTPDFIFWGRLQSQKDIPRALGLFARIHRARPDARLTLYGPDQGEGERIARRINDLGLDKAVTMAGERDHNALFAEARRVSFYLQTSREEGMAMSVIEAMRLGLVPVVTPVGEIGSYCIDGVNAVFVDHTEQTVNAVLSLLNDPVRYAAMSSAARAKWKGQPLYASDFQAACDRLLETQG